MGIGLLFYYYLKHVWKTKDSRLQLDLYVIICPSDIGVLLLAVVS